LSDVYYVVLLAENRHRWHDEKNAMKCLEDYHHILFTIHYFYLYELQCESVVQNCGDGWEELRLLGGIETVGRD